MAKGKSTWKYNKLLTARRNYFVEGGIARPTELTRGPQLGIDTSFTTLHNPMTINTPDLGTSTGINNKFKAGINLAKGAIGGMGDSIAGATTAAGAMIGNALSQGMSSTAGNIVGAVGDIAANIPVIGKFAGPALKIVGGGINALFGSKLNDANIDAAKNDIARMNNAQSNASSFDTLAATIGSTAGRTMHDKSFYGKEGLLSNAATNVMKDLEAQADIAERRQDLAFLDNANNLTMDQLNNLQANYSAFGGELNTHGGNFTNGLLFINNGGSHESNPYEGVPIGMDNEGTPNLVEEGETIFNDYVFSRRLKVPKAVRNKYRLGGPISFADATKKLAKESEERPNDPISINGLRAIMSDLANSQEELKARRQQGMFANGGMVNKFDGETTVSNYTRNPNADAPYSQGYVWAELMGRQLRKRMEELKAMPDGEEKKAAIKAFYEQANALQDSYYKDIYNSGVEWGGRALKGAGAAHQKLWNDAGYNNFGEDTYDYWYSPRNSSSDVADTWVDNIIGDLTLNRHLGDKSIISAHNYDILSKLAKDLGLNWDIRTDADGNGNNPLLYFSPIATQNDSPTPDNPVTLKEAKKRYDRYYYNTGTVDNPNYVLLEGQDNAPLWMRNNRYFFKDKNERDDGNDFYYDPNEPLNLGRNRLEFLRYTPVGMKALAAITDAAGLTNRPDYGNANAILNATRNNGTYTPVRFNPIGNKIRPELFDRDFYINKLNENAGATRRAIVQNAGMNRGMGMASLLASDYNTQGQLGQLARQAEEYNDAQRLKAEDFNRGTNMTNSQGFLQADMANQNALAKMSEMGIRGAMAAAQMRESIRQQADANRSANISGLFTDLANIGYEAKNDNMVRRTIEAGIYGPGAQKVYMGAKGGKLKRKKRGLTY